MQALFLSPGFVTAAGKSHILEKAIGIKNNHIRQKKGAQFRR
jgi:hypothetical protein